MSVLLIILLILGVLVNQYASVEVKYIGGSLKYKVRYSFIDLYSSDKKTSKTKCKNTSKKSDTIKEKNSEKISENKKEEKPEEKSKKNKKQKKPKESLDEKLEKISAIVDFVQASKKHVFNLVGNIKFSKINVDFVVADEDAYTCAVSYGAISAGVYNIVGFLSTYFKTTIDKLNINLKYNNNKSIYDFSFLVKLKLGTAITSALGILVTYLTRGRVKKPNKKQKKISEECIKMSNHPVNGLMGTTIEKIREMIDVNTIIGNPITTPEGATIIPVSKVSFGFASGGSDLPAKSQKDLFGGAAGAGVSVQPLAFICVSPSGETKLLQMSVNAKKENAIINTIPELIDKISEMVSSKGKSKEVIKEKKETKTTVSTEE